MKSFAVFLVVLIFATTESSRIQPPPQRIDDNFICPTILVDCPEANPGQIIKFKARVYQGVNVVALKFKWKVSGGKITRGQGTQEITVKTKTHKDRVTATAELLGTPKSCGRTASCTTMVGPR